MKEPSQTTVPSAAAQPRKSALLQRFSQFAGWSAEMMGSASAFVIATIAVLLWAVSGPWFGYSDTWQLVINTATTVLTFLAVFLIQHSQNKDGRAIQLKLDELIRSTQEARNTLIDLEHCTEEDMKALQVEFARRRKEAGAPEATISASKIRRGRLVDGPGDRHK